MHLAGRTAQWLNMPHQATITDKRVVMHTETETDFWQNTYHNAAQNNGHALLTEAEEEFSFSVKVMRNGMDQYDHCGLMVYLDEKNWAKLCMEYMDGEQTSGSVVTRSAFSDWAIRGVVEDAASIYYRVSRLEDNFLFECSDDGREYHQMRMFHLRCKNAMPRVGLFACSPIGDGFQAAFEEMKFTKSLWAPYVE